MPDDFTDYVTDEPTRTRRGALKYQPANSDWSLDRLSELKDYYQSTYKRPLPLANIGQGSVHNRLGYDHRSSADVSLNPNSTEGQSLITELQRRNIPFLAFDRAIPGVATGPHIHVGYASHRTATKYNVGSQVKKTAKTTQSTDDFDKYVGADPDFDKYVADDTPAKPAAAPTRAPSYRVPGFGGAAGIPTDTVRRGVAAYERPAIQAGIDAFEATRPGRGAGELRRIDDPATARINAIQRDTGIGRLRQLDEPAMQAHKQVEDQVRRERQFRQSVGAPPSINPLEAYSELASRVFGGKTEEDFIREETDRRLQASFQDTARLREIAGQFTDEDRQELAAAVQAMHGEGPTRRGISTGAQRVTSGLLYKIAALTDIAGGPGTPAFPNYLGDYLRRKAGAGEMSVQEIESELPSNVRQQLADFLTHAVGALPEVIGATAAAGPIGGFAALGGLEAAGRKQPFSTVAKEAAKGAAIGAVFQAAPAFEAGNAQTLGQRVVDTARSGAIVGLGTLAVEKAFGATDADAARAAASNVFFHAGMRVPAEIGRFAQAAERAYKQPVEEPAPTVGPSGLSAEARAEYLARRGGAGGTVDSKGSLSAIGPELQERPSRVETQAPPSIPLTETVPPAGTDAQPLTTAVPAAEQPVAAEPAALPQINAAYIRERIPEGLRGTPFTGEGLERQLGVQIPSFRALEQQGLIRRAEDGNWLVDNRVYSELHDAVPPTMRDLLDRRSPTRMPEADWLELTPEERAAVRQQIDTEMAPRRPLSELMQERAATGPSDIIDLEAKPPTEAEQFARQKVGEMLGEPDALLRAAAEKPLPTTVEPNFAAEQAIGEVKARRRAKLEQRAAAGDEAARAQLERQALDDVTDLTGQDIDAGPTKPPGKKPPKGQGGFIDLTEVVAGLQELRAKFPDKTERELRALLPPTHRELIDREQPLPAAASQPRTDSGQFAPGTPGGPEAAHSQLRSEARKYAQQYKALDYHSARRNGLDIVSDDMAHNYFRQLHRLASEHLPQQAAAVDRAESLYNQGRYGQATMLAESVFQALPDKVNQYSSAMAAMKLADMGLEAKTNWSKVLQEVRERIKRTGGLSGGGSTFYDVNKYPEGGRPDHAKIAYILEPVVEALKADASRLIAEGKLKAADYVDHVRTQVNKMLQGPEFTDWHPLNKSAAVGVLVDKLRRDGPPATTPRYPSKQLPEGVTPIRWKYELVDQRTSEVVDRFETAAEAKSAEQGPYKSRPAETYTDEPAPNPTIYAERPNIPGEVADMAQRRRSLPPTLERSGRDPGTDLTYDRLPNPQTNARVEARLAAEGADALETWYRNAPESADRTAAHRVLVDHYTARAIELADTAPRQAEQLMQRARDLSNLEDARATTMGQAVQMYSNLLKYTAPGVLREVSRMEAQGVKVPAEAVTKLVRAAKEVEGSDREVRRLEREVATAEVEAGEAPAPEGGEAPTRPRRYTPRRRSAAEGAGGADGGGPSNPAADRAERARRRLDEAAQRRRAQRAALAAQLQAIEQSRTAAGYWKRSMNLTRGLMVSALSTAMRNLQSQAVRFDVERLVDAVELTTRRAIGLDSDLTYRNIWRNTLRQFRLGQTAEAREIVSAHPGELSRMFNNYAGGVDVPIPGNARTAIERTFQTMERGVEIANIFNRLQEFHVRSAEFLAELDLHLRREHNQTLEQFVQRNGIDAIPLELVRRAVDKALEVTFADMPGRDGAGGRFLTSMIEVGNYIPPTLSPVAFPRFMFNNLKFLYQHSPAGMLDLARRNQNRPRVISRALVGTSLLLLAYQFRQSDHAGEKWYELRFKNPVSGAETTLDSRPFGPFSTYLFLAEQIRRAKAGEKLFTADEIGQAIGMSTGPAGTAIDVPGKLYKHFADWNAGNEGGWTKAMRLLKTEAGEWGRALLTPVRQVKDLIAAFDESQAINRDTSLEPGLGPIKESIPYADTNLPPAQLPATATPIRQEHPAVKAITGWRVETPKTFLQKELDSLNFTSSEIRPATGVPAIDQLEKRLMGPLMDQLSTELEKDVEYKKLSKKARAQYLKEFITDIRDEVRELGKAEHPELYEQLQEERKPARQREYEQELNSPGLSKAIQLGVPMSIPPMQPGEDDIAYRARLLQLGRQRRARLDSAYSPNLPANALRERLYQSVYA